MMTNRPELFRNNPDPTDLIPIDDHYAQALRRLGSRVIQPYYAGPDPLAPQRDVMPPRHILAEMCRLAGLRGIVALRPYIHLTAAERAPGRFGPRQIAIHTSGMAAAVPFTTKEWGAGRFADVVRELGRDFKFVQLGSPQDPPLQGAVDLRGATTPREAAAVLSASELFIGLEGFLSHLARAVDCRSVVVMGGRAAPAIVGYGCNANLYSPVSCAPCGLRSGCPHEMKCMAAISPLQVVEAARDLLRLPPIRPLPAETCELP